MQLTRKSLFGVRGGLLKVSHDCVLPLLRSPSNQRPNLPPPAPMTRFSRLPCRVGGPDITRKIYWLHFHVKLEGVSSEVCQVFSGLKCLTFMNNWFSVVHLYTWRSPESGSREKSQLSPVPGITKIFSDKTIKHLSLRPGLFLKSVEDTFINFSFIRPK